MATALAIKSSRRYMMPNILLSFICCICSILAAHQSFLLSYLMTIIVSRNWLILGFMFFFGYLRKRSKKVKRTTISNYQPKNHQVFLNFRGDQVHHSFISHLSNGFKNKGIKLFVDDDMIAGKDLKNLFLKIEESRIALAIFSTRYPDSKWCMNELVKMKKRAGEGKLHVIPIFYQVNPSHVKRPTCESEFGRKFWRLMEVSDRNDLIQEWREALECISNKLGLYIEEKSCEADFVKVIVKAVERVNEETESEKEENHGGKIKEKFRAFQFVNQRRILQFHKSMIIEFGIYFI